MYACHIHLLCQLLFSYLCCCFSCFLFAVINSKNGRPTATHHSIQSSMFFHYILDLFNNRIFFDRYLFQYISHARSNLTPILLPIATSIGIDPVQFGIIMVLNCGIGLLTPPVGSVLFIGSAVSGVKMERVVKATLPFYICMIIVLMLLTFIPEVSLLLPRVFGGYGG